MHRFFNINIHVFLLVLLSLVFFHSSALAATLSFRTVKDNSEGELSLMLFADKLDKLAGIKVTLVYPKNLLNFQKAEKSEATASFLHVVNDKNAGKLIVVMASATGISGSEVALVQFHFIKNKQASKKAEIIEIIGCELMSEDLKEIPCENIFFKL